MVGWGIGVWSWVLGCQQHVSGWDEGHGGSVFFRAAGRWVLISSSLGCGVAAMDGERPRLAALNFQRDEVAFNFFPLNQFESPPRGVDRWHQMGQWWVRSHGQWRTKTFHPIHSRMPFNANELHRVRICAIHFDILGRRRWLGSQIFSGPLGRSSSSFAWGTCQWPVEKATLLCVFSGLGNSKVLHLRGALVSHLNLSILDLTFTMVGLRLLRQLVMDMGPRVDALARVWLIVAALWLGTWRNAAHNLLKFLAVDLGSLWPWTPRSFGSTWTTRSRSMGRCFVLQQWIGALWEWKQGAWPAGQYSSCDAVAGGGTSAPCIRHFWPDAAGTSDAECSVAKGAWRTAFEWNPASPSTMPSRVISGYYNTRDRVLTPPPFEDEMDRPGEAIDRLLQSDGQGRGAADPVEPAAESGDGSFDLVEDEIYEVWEPGMWCKLHQGECGDEGILTLLVPLLFSRFLIEKISMAIAREPEVAWPFAQGWHRTNLCNCRGSRNVAPAACCDSLLGIAQLKPVNSLVRDRELGISKYTLLNVNLVWLIVALVIHRPPLGGVRQRLLSPDILTTGGCIKEKMYLKRVQGHFLLFFLFFSLGHFSLLFATLWSKDLYFAEFGAKMCHLHCSSIFPWF